MLSVKSRSARIAAFAVLTALAISACSSEVSSIDAPTIEQSEAGDAAAPETQQALGSVSSVQDLQEAFLAAGGDCDGDLEDINNVKSALGSGVCSGSGTVLTIYVGHDAAEGAVTTLMGMMDRIGSTMILGENWAINPAGNDLDHADEIATALGGQLLTTEATPVRSLDEAFTLEQAAEAYDQADGTSCADPVDVGSDVSVLECADLTLIVEADQPMSSEALRQATADALELDGATPIVGRRHIVAIYSDDIDIDTVARQIDGVTPSN